MNCIRCGTWTKVVETRSRDGGHTVLRTRVCGNDHRFTSFEVYGPIYRNDPQRVQQCVTAAAARAFRYQRNLQIRRDAKTMTVAEAARKNGVTAKLAVFVRTKWKP